MKEADKLSYHSNAYINQKGKWLIIIWISLYLKLWYNIPLHNFNEQYF